MTAGPGSSRPELLEGDLSIPLADLGMVEVSGPDALPFVAAQLTSDVRGLTPATSQLGAWCTPAGRVLTIMRICRREEAMVLILPAAAVRATRERLQRYVLRARVTLSDGAGRIQLLGLSGPAALARIAARLGAAPQAPDGVVHGASLTALRIPGNPPRCLILGPAAEVRGLLEDLPTGVAVAGAESWDLLDILAGIPTVVPATAEHFLPQMLNLDALGGLSYSKGCYPGQEVIARLKYRGSLKRRMYLASVDASAAPAPATRLCPADRDTAVGEVVSAAAHPSRGIALLAVVDIEAAQSAAVHLGDPGGALLQFEPLPYPVPED